MNSQNPDATTQALFNAARPRYPELKGRVAIVTGSSGGIGRGIAIRLAREGMKVVVNGRRAEVVERTAQELRALGAEALPVTADMARRADLATLVDRTVEAFGSVDLLVNNAAFMTRVPFFQIGEVLLDESVNTNVYGPFLLSHRVAALMKAKGGGCIVHISTVGAFRAHAPGLPYDATKAAMDAMTRCMGIELFRDGIRVNGVAPGAIRDDDRPDGDARRAERSGPLIPARRIGTALDVAGAVAFLASDEASYIVGQTLYVDGGITTQLAPVGYQV
jgi:NAD(P)-dependent dehydrogenase (short-subunit alcohol dehydrogenase family)